MAVTNTSPRTINAISLPLGETINSEASLLIILTSTVLYRRSLRKDRRYNTVEVKMINSDASEFIVSPNGKEIAFIVRGEVFVTAIDYDITKRITNTPEQERDLDFNSDGTKLLYS